MPLQLDSHLTIIEMKTQDNILFYIVDTKILGYSMISYDLKKTHHPTNLNLLLEFRLNLWTATYLESVTFKFPSFQYGVHLINYSDSENALS